MFNARQRTRSRIKKLHDVLEREHTFNSYSVVLFLVTIPWKLTPKIIDQKIIQSYHWQTRLLSRSQVLVCVKVFQG